MAGEIIQPGYNTQPAPLQNGAIPTYPTPSVAPIASNPLNTYSQVVGTMQANQNMRNQSQQMKRDQISFDEQQRESKLHARQLLLQQGATQEQLDTFDQTGRLPGEQAHQSFLQGIASSPIGQAIAHGFHAIHGLVHGPSSGIPAQGQASAAQAPAAQSPNQAPAAQGVQQGPPIPDGYMRGGVVTKPAFMTNKPVSVEATQTPAPKILAFAAGGPVPDGGLDAYAMSGAQAPPHAPTSPSSSGDSGGGAGMGAMASMAGSFFQDGGAVPDHPSGFGVVTGGVRGIQGFEKGGAVPATPAAAAPQVMSPQAAQLKFVQTVEDHAAHLHGLALNDAGHEPSAGGIPSTGPVPVPGVNAPDAAPAPQGATPAPAQGPTPAAPVAAPQAPPAAQGAPLTPEEKTATAAVASGARTDATALAGQVTTTPAAEGKPKSISAQDWDKSDQGIAAASAAAALAGHDGSAVAASLNANRNAWIQGHVLRWLSVANTQLLDTNKSPTERANAVQDAMKNAYYYIPDGQNLNITKDKNGQLTYQDPINPTGADGKPNMIPVDAAHIQMLGQAMLDPMNVQTTIQNIRMAQAQMYKEMQQGNAAAMTGQARVTTANSKAGEVNSTNYKNIGMTDAALIRSRAIANHLANLVSKTPNQDPELQKTAQIAADGFEKMAAGEVGTVPTQVPDTRPGHQGEMTPNTDPNAGKPFRDPTKIPAELKSLTPSQVMEGKAVAGEITIANRGKSAAEAQRLAALYMAGKTSAPSAPDPAGGKKPVANVHTDAATGDTWVWNKAMKKWETFKLSPQSAQQAASGGSVGPADPVAAAEVASNGGIAANSAPGADDNEARYASEDAQDRQLEGS